MNPSCSLPPLVDIYRVGRRGSSSGPSFHGEGWESFSWPFLWGGGTLGITFSWSRCGARFWSLRRLDLLVPSRARVPGPSGPHFFVLSQARFFFVLSWARSSWFFEARRSWSFGASISRFIDCGARFSSSIQGLDFFFILRGLDFLVRPGLNFLVRSGARYFHRCQRLQVQFLCDNAAVVAILNSGSSQDQPIMHLVRRLTLVACRQHFSFSARHIPGHRNAAADALSRLHFPEFHRLLPSADPLPPCFRRPCSTTSS